MDVYEVVKTTDKELPMVRHSLSYFLCVEVIIIAKNIPTTQAAKEISNGY
jgi:hypothetical protein